MIFKSVNHAAVIVSDLEKSSDFYIGKLGFKLLKKIDRPEKKSVILYLDAGENVVLEIFSFPHPPERLTYPEACGLRHLAFNVDDFDGALVKLASLGIRTEAVSTDERTKKRMTFFKDPDGLPLEICEV